MNKIILLLLLSSVALANPSFSLSSSIAGVNGIIGKLNSAGDTLLSTSSLMQVPASVSISPEEISFF